jgi:hypothetical protein
MGCLADQLSIARLDCDRRHRNQYSEDVMCDYSMRFPCSRMAKAGDKLVTTRIGTARGFALAENRLMGICLSPVTELAFEGPVKTFTLFGPRLSRWLKRGKPRSVALFRRKINRGARQDVLEYPDGHFEHVTWLCEGQVATVLQLPVLPRIHKVMKRQKLRGKGATPRAVQSRTKGVRR